jgi:hypothetical protein
MLICNSEDFVSQRWALGCISSKETGATSKAKQIRCNLTNEDSLDIAMNLPIPCVVLLWQKILFSHTYSVILQKNKMSVINARKKKKNQKKMC